jgi:hypothetical protein
MRVFSHFNRFPHLGKGCHKTCSIIPSEGNVIVKTPALSPAYGHSIFLNDHKVSRKEMLQLDISLTTWSPPVDRSPFFWPSKRGSTLCSLHTDRSRQRFPKPLRDPDPELEITSAETPGNLQHSIRRATEILVVHQTAAFKT